MGDLHCVDVKTPFCGISPPSQPVVDLLHLVVLLDNLLITLLLIGGGLSSMPLVQPVLLVAVHARQQGC